MYCKQTGKTLPNIVKLEIDQYLLGDFLNSREGLSVPFEPTRAI